VADEIDAAHAGRRALVDFEDKIDPVLRQLDDLGLDRGGEAGVPAVDVKDTLHIVLHPRTRVDDARTQLNLAVEIFVRKLRVTLKGDPIDDRILDHANDQHVPLAVKLDIGEQTGREERFQRGVNPFGIPRITGLQQHVRSYGLWFDTLQALDFD